MRSWQWWSRFGIALTFVFILFGELLWIFDPVKLAGRIYWIDLLDYIIYLCLFIPLIWFMTAAVGLLRVGKLWGRKQQSRFGCLCLGLVRSFAAVSSAFAIYSILADPYQIIRIGVSFVMAFLFTLADPVLERWVISRKISWKETGFLGISICLLAVFCWPTPYTVTYPGLTMNMNHYAKVQGGQTNGEIMGVLIFERPAFPVDWIYAKWNSYYEFKRRKTDVPLDKQLQTVRIMKQDANQVGSAIAFREMDMGRGAVFHGAKIMGIIPGTPAAAKLKAGDVLTALNGQTLHSAAELIQYIGKLNPGDEIMLRLERNRQPIVLNLLLQADSSDPEKARLGVQIADDIQLDLPLNVDFHPYMIHEGGPSHGAMLALSLIDQLTPGGVTNGNIVAGTGTIDIHGLIGPIGGIEQKAYTVERAGADVFFVPAEQLKDARKGSDKLNIVPVENLEQILAWLAEHKKPNT